MISTELVVAWEDAYRRYEGAAGPNIIDTSRAVASAWIGIAGGSALPWWASAAVRSAAEAFERQAEAWQARSIREAGISPPPRELVRSELLNDGGLESAVKVPQARKPEDCVAASPDPDSPEMNEAASV